MAITVTVNGTAHSFSPLPAEVLHILTSGGLWAAKASQEKETTP